MKRPVKRHEVQQPPDASYRLIPLTQGQNTIVDAADYEWLNQWNWLAHWNPHTKSFYASRYAVCAARCKTFYMAREIMGCGKAEEADHISHDTLDNRRTNLRKSTRQQNARNKRRRLDSQNQYKGICWRRDAKKWTARINGVHLGYFSDPVDAAHAYDEAAKRLHGEFACLNFIS
jgi:hypothetical protein